MSVGEKMFEALRQAIITNERIEQVDKVVTRLDAGQSELRERVVRLEVTLDLAKRLMMTNQTGRSAQ